MNGSWTLFNVETYTIYVKPLMHACNFGVHQCEVFVGEVAETYASEQYLADIDSQHKIPDMGKINPIILSPDLKYWKVGESFAKAYSVGKGCQKKSGTTRNINP